MRAFQASSHTPGPEPVLGDIPHSVHHRVENIVTPRGAKSERACAHIVPERIAHQGRGEWAKVGADQRAFLRGDAAFNDLLRSPRAVLVNADDGEMRDDSLEHGEAEMRRGPFKELLDDSVSNVVARKLGVSM